MPEIDLFEERYKPQTLDDVLGNDVHILNLKAQVKDVKENIEKIRILLKKREKLLEKEDLNDEESNKRKKIVNSINKKIKELKQVRIRHQIFAGPAGIGKTSTAYAMARDIFGDDVIEHYHAFNMSDDRKIDFIRYEIKTLTRQIPGDYPFKIIVMDEADGLLPDSQDALRRIIEDKHFAVVILICNHVDKIIDPLQSRCTVKNFKKIDMETAIKRLKEICVNENIEYDEDFLEELYLIRSGDMRSCVGILGELKPLNKKLTVDLIQETKIEEKELESFLKSVCSGNMFHAFRAYQRLSIDYSVGQKDFIYDLCNFILKKKFDNNFKAEIFTYSQIYTTRGEDDLNILSLCGKIYLMYIKYVTK